MVMSNRMKLPFTSLDRIYVVFILLKIIIIIIIIIIVIVIIITIIKCRDRYRTPTTTNTELLVMLHNDRKPLSNIKKSSPSDGVSASYMPLKRLIHHLTWWIGVDHAPWIPCMELSPTWFLKNNCNGNINQLTIIIIITIIITVIVKTIIIIVII